MVRPGLDGQSSCIDVVVPGKVVDLPPAAEEVAGFYAALLESDHAQDKTFNENFFDDWVKVLGKHPAVCFTF